MQKKKYLLDMELRIILSLDEVLKKNQSNISFESSQWNSCFIAQLAYGDAQELASSLCAQSTQLVFYFFIPEYKQRGIENNQLYQSRRIQNHQLSLEEEKKFSLTWEILNWKIWECLGN